MSLNLLIGSKKNDTNDKHAKTKKKKFKKIGKNTTQIRYFFKNHKKLETEIFAFSVITFEPIKI